MVNLCKVSKNYELTSKMLRKCLQNACILSNENPYDYLKTSLGLIDAVLILFFSINKKILKK